MGSCLSKPDRPKDVQHVEASSAAAPAPAAQEQAARNQQQQQVSVVPGASPAGSVEGWTAPEVVSWATGLGLGPQATAALQVRSPIAALCCCACPAC